MRKRHLLILLLLFGVIPSLKGQQVERDSSTIYLSLREAQDYAIEHNRTLKNSSLDVRKSEASRWQSIATMLPQVNATANYANYMGYKMSLGAGMEISMPTYIQYGVSAGIALSGAQVISAELGTISMKMSDVTRKQTEQEVAEQVKLLYFSALVTEETIDLLQKNLESIKRLYSFSLKSVEVGVSEKVAADQILVQVATMETNLSSSKRSLEIIYNSLRLQLNINFDKEIKLTQTMDELLDIQSSLGLLVDEFSLSNNYTYQLVQRSTELTKKQMQLAGWAYGPSLSAAYQYSGRKNFTDGGFNMTPPNLVSLTLTVPIFSSGKTYNSYCAAKIEYEKQQNKLADTEMSLMIQHRQLRYNLSSAFERYETQKKNVEVSQSVFENIGKKYEYGLSSSLDVTTSGTNLIAAQSSYVSAALEFVNAKIELEKLLNKNYFE